MSRYLVKTCHANAAAGAPASHFRPGAPLGPAAQQLWTTRSSTQSPPTSPHHRSRSLKRLWAVNLQLHIQACSGGGTLLSDRHLLSPHPFSSKPIKTRRRRHRPTGSLSWQHVSPVWKAGQPLINNVDNERAQIQPWHNVTTNRKVV